MFFCGRSDYFRALLEYTFSESPVKDSFNESITEIYLNDVTPDVFAAVVAFIYQNDALVSDVTTLIAVTFFFTYVKFMKCQQVSLCFDKLSCADCLSEKKN